MAESDAGRARSPPAVEPETVLLLARPGDAAASSYCDDHLAARGDPDAAPLLIRTDRPAAGPTPVPDVARRRGTVVVVGDSTRSAAVAASTPDPPATSPGTVLATGDLGSVGGTVDGYLTAWAAEGHRPVVCVDSISGLLEIASMRATYRFLYVLLRRVDDLGGVAHAHADPRDHDEEILRTFFSLFDRIVSFRDGGASRG